MKIIGREAEQEALKRYRDSGTPEFLAIYGRRRVGKTFLIREFFNDEFAFQLTGVSNGKKEEQIDYFNKAMRKYGKGSYTAINTWSDAFDQLIHLLEHSKSKGRQIIFLDELPWLDTPKSGFLSALEHFWNSWGSAHPQVFLIVCGSATSWIIRRVLRNRGGLHNRVTRRMRLESFTLAECEQFFIDRYMDYDRKTLAECYMVFGGVPFYLSLFEGGLSLAQNVDALCFAKNAALADEFEELFSSLFKNAGMHMSIVEALAQKKKGLTRDQIIKAANTTSGGGLTSVLDELEQSGFIQVYQDYSGKSGRYCYQLVDFFSLFYLTHMKARRSNDRHYWSNNNGKPSLHAWSGYAFELVCLVHEQQIKQALGIAGVSTSTFSWRSRESQPGAQIDLLLDRSDNVINLCEIKFCKGEFAIDKAYGQTLCNKREAFGRESHTRKTIHMTMITSYGLKQNAYSNIIQSQLTLDDIFKLAV